MTRIWRQMGRVLQLQRYHEGSAVAAVSWSYHGRIVVVSWELCRAIFRPHNTPCTNYVDTSVVFVFTRGPCPTLMRCPCASPRSAVSRFLEMCTIREICMSFNCNGKTWLYLLSSRDGGSHKWNLGSPFWFSPGSFAGDFPWTRDSLLWVTCIIDGHLPCSPVIKLGIRPPWKKETNDLFSRSYSNVITLSTACLFTRLRAEESSDFKMAASRCAITFHRKTGRVKKELEFQKELNMIHYPRAAVCLFTRQRAE